jgi:hypothetical protein
MVINIIGPNSGHQAHKLGILKSVTLNRRPLSVFKFEYVFGKAEETDLESKEDCFLFPVTFSTVKI